VRHEIETRRFSISFHDSPLVRGATETQRLLRQLDDAIQLAVAGGLLDAATTITMQQVGRTGLIDMLPALPAGGRYVVERSDKPPHALFGDRRINLSPAALAEQIAAETRRIASDRPDYPPALALRARYEDPEAALATVTRAIELWPDVPALRIQRIALRSRLLRVEELPEDLDYLLARFPSTPILLEIDTATRQGALATEPTFRVGLALSLAELRPEVLPIQLLALRECLEHGDRRAAIRIYDRLVQRHPGYEQVVVNPRRL
jgi:hypothetical protein